MLPSSSLRTLGLGAAFMLAALTAHAAPSSATTPHVQIELLAPFEAVRPGEDLLIGLRERIVPHWHTYWINPGDSGLPTTLTWTLPDGSRAGDLLWPAPSRFQTGPVTNYGYAGEVVLLSPVRVPATLRPGQRLTLGAHVSWLVCNEVCIPEEADLALDLPVVAASAPRGPLHPQIEAARAALPGPAPWPVRFESADGQLQLRLDGAATARSPASAWFYSDEWGKTDHGASQTLERGGDALILRIKAGEAPAVPGNPLNGILSLTDADGAVHAYAVAGSVTAGAPSAASAAVGPSGVEDAPGFLAALLLALAGGVILNLMPCVFPVLSIKALSLVRHAHHDAGQVRRQGLAYAAGVLSSFALLGGLLAALRAGGAEAGWGFQFQSPLFVLGVAWLMFAVGLGLSGALSVGHRAGGIGASLAARPGYAGSFFTGVLATVVATPCTAPFMGAAIGFALTRPTAELLAIFLSLGLGLALPYLALSFWPALQRRLPRPGAWMERLKELLAFPMYGAAIWLVWVLAQQAGPQGIVVALGGMLAIAFCAWLASHAHAARPVWRHAGRGLALLSLGTALAAAWIGLGGEPARAASLTATTPSQAWEPFSQHRFDTLRAEGKPVFVNFTAAWCITCLANEQVALSSDTVQTAFRQAGVTYLKGDWTHQDPEISAHLARFGRSGVPLYLYYPPGRDSAVQVLPQLLTPATVTGVLTASAPRG